ncbi:hypothetical protein DFAR_400027 [Desulfarculales bacterium]
MQIPAAPCPSHQAHITGLDAPFQMECMPHFLPGICTRQVRSHQRMSYLLFAEHDSMPAAPGLLRLRRRPAW